jgi:predicted TIM-barrel fold metal-dependent hydrolase
VTELIDVHSHFVTEDYILAATRAGHRQPEGMPRWAGWSAGEHLALMDQAGIRTSMLSVSSPGTHFGDDAAARQLSRQLNEFGAELVRAHPGRFGHFASLPFPDVSGSLDELAYALDILGSDGVALLSNAHGVYLGDERYEPVYAELDRRAATVFVHPVSPPNWQQVSLNRPRPMLEFLFDSARTASDLVLRGVLARYPDINWIFSHSGGALPVLAERIELFGQLLSGGSAGAGEDGAPVTEQLGRLWYDIAGTPFPHAAPALVRAFGSERVLYGSDYCWTPCAGVLAQVASMDGAPQPDGQTWRALTTRNAERLIPRLCLANPATGPRSAREDSRQTSVSS